MTSTKSTGHGRFASLFGLIILVIPGLLSVLFSVSFDILPETFRTVNVEGMSETAARVRELTKGTGLLVLAWGLRSFARWSWYACAAWAVWTVYHLSQTMLSGVAVVTLDGLSILVPLALPYLWLKRREFGTGSARRVGT